MASERLVVTMEAKDQLSPALKNVAKAAADTNKEVEKLTSADVANFGRGMLRGATTLATGLYGLAKASSDLAEAQNFSNQIFKDAAPAINKYAKEAATAIGMSERAALDAAASVGIFGQRIELTGADLAKFSTNLVTLAADMASIKNTKPEEAVTAIAAAMRNEYEPIRRYGVVLNDVVLKARALEQGTYDGTGQLTQQQKIIAVNAELYEQLGFAMGDFARTQGELANQTRIAQAQFENLKANLGDALRPAFINLTSAANTVLETLMKIPEPVKEIGANIGLMGAGVLGLGGAIVFTVGKVGQMVDGFRELRAKMDATRASGGRTANTLLTLGKAAAGLGLVAMGSQIAFDAINSITDVAGDATTAVKELNIALAAGKKNDAWSSFLDIAKAKDDALTFGHLWTDAGKKIQLMGSDTKRPIEDLDAAFKSLLDQNPDQARQVLDIMKEQTNTLDKNSGQYKDNTMLIERWGKQLSTETQNLQALGNEGELSAETLEQFGDASLESAEASKEAAKAYEDAADTLADYARNLGDAERSFDTAAETAESFSDALEKTIGTSTALDNLAAINQAVFDLGENWKDADGNIDKAAMTLDVNTEAGRKNIAAVDELASAIGEDLSRVYQESGGDVEAVKAKADEYTWSLLAQLAAADATEEQIADYLKTLGLTPEQIETAIKLKDQDVAMQKLEMLNLEYDKIPSEIATQILAKVDEGDYIGAYNMAKGWIAGAGPLDIQAMADQASATAAGEDALAAAQAGVDGGPPVGMPTEVEAPTNGWDVFNEIDSFFGKNQPTTEVDVKPGDIETPQRKNRDYAKNNKPETEIETKPGDYQAAWRTINSYMTSHDPIVTIETKPGNIAFTWNVIAFYFAARPVKVTVNADVGNIGAVWSVIAFYFAARPVTVTVNADDGNLHGAWSSIQSYFNNHPITVKVNTVQGTVSAPRVPGATGTAARPGTEAAAMETMGLTAVGDTLLAAPSPARAGYAAPTSTPQIINLNVAMPTGVNEHRVVDLLRRYARSNGVSALPRR